MTLLKNETVSLRALEPEDLDILYRWENNPDLWNLGSTLSPYSRYILKEYIRESHRDLYETKQLRLMIDLCSTGDTIGTVDLFDFESRHRRVAIGILIDPLYRGKGYAKQTLELLMEYVFTFLHMHQLYVHVPIWNESCKMLFTHCGFVISGTLKEWIWTEKGYSDVLIMQKVNPE